MSCGVSKCFQCLKDLCKCDLSQQLNHSGILLNSRISVSNDGSVIHEHQFVLKLLAVETNHPKYFETDITYCSIIVHVKYSKFLF